MIRQRDFLTRNRHRIALLAVLSGIVFAVGFEHAGIGYGGMADMDADHGAGGVVVVCLAVVGLGGLALSAAGFSRAGRVRAVLALPSILSPAFGRAPVSFPARAGPAELQVFRR